MTTKEIIGILTIVSGMFGALIVGLPSIMESYGTLTKDNIEQVTDEVAQKLAMQNAHKIDSLYTVAEKEFISIYSVVNELKNKKGFAVSIRKDKNNSFNPDGLLYRATDGNTYPAYWREEYMFFFYFDLRDGKEHPIFYEDKVSLEQMKYRAKVLYGVDE